MTLRGGTRLGAYEILAPLGAGGMGEVYRARDTRLGREIAVKVLPDHLTLDASARARFEREARAVAALSHPNILDIHDVGSEQGISFAVTELLDGETLAARLGRGALPWRKAVEIGVAVADGLGAAHARGVVHRDLKPSNVFLTSDGRVKILDFGIATLEAHGPAADGNEQAVITETGALVGTAGYMSPEQIRRRSADARSDIFSFGCLLYEMVTGCRPFTGETAPEALVATLRREPRDPVDLAPGIPEDLRLLILRCLEKDPIRRFQAAADLSFALKLAASAPPPARVSASAPTIATPAPTSRRRLRVLLSAAVLLVAAGLIAVVRTRSPRSSSTIESLAVLPFVNASANGEDEYLSDGITESLINAVSRLPRLRVLARTTVFRYRNADDPAKVGRQLGVQAVLSGRVQRYGDRIVVQAELVEVDRGSQLWGERFTESASRASSLPGEIAEKISRSLPAGTVSGPGGPAAPRAASDPEAWDLCLRARYHLNKRTEEGIVKSLALFEEASRKDPNEALAWLGLADVYNLLAYYDMQPPLELLPKQREAARRAIALDPTLSGAHAALADVMYQFEWDWKRAEEEFRKALALNPNDATAHQWYSNFLSASGRFEEALAEIRLARRLDPVNVVINMDVGLASYFAGNDAEASLQLQKTIDLDPQFPLTYLYLGFSDLRTGRLREAVDDFEKAMKLTDGAPDPVAAWGHACARAGRKADAEEALRRLEAMSKKRFVSALAFAFLEVGRGNREKALSWLEKAADERSGRLAFLRVLSPFDPLREEPRFQAVVRRLHIPPET